MRIVIIREEVQDLLRYKRTEAYNTINLIRDLYPSSEKLKPGRCCVRDLADYYSIPEGDIQQFLQSRS